MSARGRPGRTAALALGLALAAALLLAFWPCSGRRVSPVPAQVGRVGPAPEPVESCVSLVEMNGARVLGVLAVPVALVAGGLAFAALRLRAALWTLAAAALAFCVLAMFSVGIFFLPSSVTLLAAAARPWRRGPEPLT